MSSDALIRLLTQGTSFENKRALERIEDIIKKEKSTTSPIFKKGEGAILLLSGGMDSICLWFLLLHKYKIPVYPIFCFVEGKENTRQWESVASFSDLFKKKFPRLFHDPIKKPVQLDFSLRDFLPLKKPDIRLLLSHGYFTPEGIYKTAIVANPTRLFSYLGQAFNYALSLRFGGDTFISTILVGTVPEDTYICREATLTVLRSMTLTFCLIMGDFRYLVTAPIDKKNGFYMTKKDLLLYAYHRGVPVYSTWSCEQKNAKQCGMCPSCRLRKDTFKRAGIIDKTLYELPINKIPNYIQKKIKSAQTRLKRQLHDFQKQSAIQEASLFRISPSISWEEIDGSIYRLNTVSGKLDVLNDSGAQIWKTITKQKSLKSILSTTYREYPDRSRILLKKDVHTFLSTQMKEGFVIIKS